MGTCCGSEHEVPGSANTQRKGDDRDPLIRKEGGSLRSSKSTRGSGNSYLNVNHGRNASVSVSVRADRLRGHVGPDEFEGEGWTRIYQDFVIVEKFLKNAQYENLRRMVESEALEVPGIDEVIFEVDYFAIHSTDELAIKKASKILELVAWRMPVVKGWALTNDSAYDKLMNEAGIADKGLWQIIPTQRFMRTFTGQHENRSKVLSQIVLIDNGHDLDYLYSNDFITDYESSEFALFKDQLTRIRSIQTHEIVLIGQRLEIERLVIDIRRHEVKNADIDWSDDTNLNPFDKLQSSEWLMDNEDRETNLLTLYEATLSGFPSTVQSPELLAFLTDECSINVLTCTIMKNSKTGSIHAKIDFSKEEEREKLQDMIENDGLKMNDSPLKIKIHEIIEKQRRLRRVSSRHKCF